MFAVLEYNVGEDYCLARLRLHGPWKPDARELWAEIIPDTLNIVQGTVLPPDLPGLLSQTLVGLKPLLRNSQDKTVNITSHDTGACPTIIDMIPNRVWFRNRSTCVISWLARYSQVQSWVLFL